MTYGFRVGRISACLIALGALLLPLSFSPSPAHASSPPQCRSTQLSVSSSAVSGSAGTQGGVFVLTNKSFVSCTVSGFATLAIHTESPSKHRITVVDDAAGSQVFDAAKVRSILLSAGDTSSFGVAWPDAYNQNAALATAAKCLVSSTRVMVQNVPVGRVASKFNICFANFKIFESPLERGSVPRRAGLN